MAQTQKHHQTRQDAEEIDTDVPQGAESEIDTAALEATLTEIDEVLAEQVTEETARAEFHGLAAGDQEAIAAFNEKYEQLGMYAEFFHSTCGCSGDATYLFNNGRIADYVLH